MREKTKAEVPQGMWGVALKMSGLHPEEQAAERVEVVESDMEVLYFRKQISEAA